MSNDYPIEKALATSPLFRQIFDLARTIRRDNSGAFAIILSEDLYWKFRDVVNYILTTPTMSSRQMVSPSSIFGVNIGRLYDVDGTLGKIILMPTGNENNDPPEVYLAKQYGLPVTEAALQRPAWNAGFSTTIAAGQEMTLEKWINENASTPEQTIIDKEKEPQPVTETPPPIPIDIRKRRLNLD